MVELFSEMNLIKRSVLRASRNGPNEFIHTLGIIKNN